jgi:3-isopropylmalate/(R)-2-methylmalate dehydratase small subunit
MALRKILEVSGTCVSVPGDDVDTDRIIPARYLKCVTFEGLGDFLFYDVRFEQNGEPKNYSLNDPRFNGATILICGRNFGCGSSREHAPQAIYRYGFRAVVAESFGEIFFGNATTLGLPCVSASRHDLDRIRQMVESEPKSEMTVDLVAEEIRFGGDNFSASIRPSARDALINGRWDPIGELLEASALVTERIAQLPYGSDLMQTDLAKASAVAKPMADASSAKGVKRY